MAGCVGHAASRSIFAGNANFVGMQGGRTQILTPALLLDLDTVDGNILAMQVRCDSAGISLRPHAKAHKCVEIARRQLTAGSGGICVATPGEAEIFAKGGIGDILLTSTFAPGAALELLADTAQRCRLTLVLDCLETAEALGKAAKARSLTIPVLIDLDTGRHRSGVRRADDIRALARSIERCEGLLLVGLQAYAGHLSHCPDPNLRAEGALAVAAIIRQAKEIVCDYMNDVEPIVTGGSTGALLQEMALDLYTEVQCGSYVLMDTEYDEVDPDGSGTPLFPTSLFVGVRVTSANHPGVATTDGGEKRFSAKKGTLPVIRRGAPAGAIFRPSSDEHGTVTFPEAFTLPVGTFLELQVPHCDPTVNLYDFFHVVQGDKLIDIWPIDARGA